MKIISSLIGRIVLMLTLICLFNGLSFAQKTTSTISKKNYSVTSPKKVTKFGKASYYANKFQGSKTASGETYLHELYTAACNILPLNTWIKITNLTNNISIIAKINDRMHPKNKRLVDLSKSAAKKLGYISAGLADVKVEILNNYDPDQGVLVN